MKPRTIPMTARSVCTTCAGVLGLGLVMLWLSATTAQAADGAALYGEHCAKCHGSDGKANTPVGKAMKAPALAALKLDLETIRKMVRENPKHQPVSSQVSDDELAAIAQHIRTLEASN